MQKPKAVFCWSGGKDSALALFKAKQSGQFDIVALLTTCNENQRRISMHGVRDVLLDAQAASIGLPLAKVWVKEGSNEEYERVMKEKLLHFKEQGVTHVFFGDIFLEDLRAYRERKLEEIGLKAVFPLWKKNTASLIHEFTDTGFETVICCVSTRFLHKDDAGKKIDADFIAQLPPGVDPCGENGEFHTFCYKGPVFSHEIRFSTGEKIYKPITEFGAEGKDGFWFIDIIPDTALQE